MNPYVFILAAALFLSVGCGTTGKRASEANLRDALTFYASFDHGEHADFAKGGNVLYHAASMRAPGRPGLPTNGYVTLAQGEGKFGDALRFHRRTDEMIYFEARGGNVDYKRTNWNGTVSFWLKVDPETELAPGYTDPIQITPKGWNDAAFFVEFGKDEKPRHFRLGAYADLKAWNPENRDWNTLTMAEKPLLGVERPPFGKDKWTHVAFTWERFNTGKPDAVATLYLNGESQGSLTNWVQTFTWDIEKTRIMLGLAYIGLWDELAIFDRALTPAEIRLLRDLPRKIQSPERRP